MFNVGDKVILKSIIMSMDNDMIENPKGIIVYYDKDDDTYLIDLGDDYSGHNGGGIYHKYTCFWTVENKLELFKNSNINKYR